MSFYNNNDRKVAQEDISTQRQRVGYTYVPVNAKYIFQLQVEKFENANAKEARSDGIQCPEQLKRLEQ